MDLTSLSNLVSAPSGIAQERNQGQPLEIPLDRIIPGDNPRTKFDAPYLERLAASIKARGVKSPISVKRISPDEAGAWFAEQGLSAPEVLEGFFKINHGECRYKASAMAGKPSIPAIVDERHMRVDALIENIQRKDLDPLDIANAIKWELEHHEGLKKVDIARELGVSGSYVSNHLKLLTLPDPVAAMVREGRSKDVTSLIQLASAWHDFPAQISDFCATSEEPTQSMVRQFVATLRDQKPSSLDGPTVRADDAKLENGGAAKRAGQESSNQAGEQARHIDIEQHDKVDMSNATAAGRDCVVASPDARITGLEIRHDGRAAVLLLQAPKSNGLAWIKYDGDGHATQIALRTIEEVITFIIS